MFSPNLNTVLDRLMTVNQVFDEAAQRTPASVDGRTRTQLWMPPVDLYETESAFVIEADLPGVHQENVDIQFDRNTLTISGTRAATLPSREKNSQLRVFGSERVSGAFSRSIRLPEHVDADKIAAKLTDGVLGVTVPKSSQAVPRRISISSPVSQKSIDG
jgi:HSP20 family protein